MFSGQLYEDKSLALHTHNLFFFTTDLQTVNYLRNEYAYAAPNKGTTILYWEGLHLNFARDPKYSWFHELPKFEFIAYIYILL